LLGFFVHHSSLRLGKICRSDHSVFTVFFYEEKAERCFERDAFVDNVLVRTVLPLGTRCLLGKAHCRIDGYEGELRPERPAVYRVTTDEALTRLATEVELTPVGVTRDDPVSSLAGLHADGYALFSARAKLLETILEVVRQAGGEQALLSSRIDVRPHQAYVAGVVLQDRVRRYILADEVGLGKTVEAGVIVQDLLSTDSSARVLILCPGALTQQWLCEFYTKFSSRVFTLLELYPEPRDLPSDRRKTVIAPLQSIAGNHREWLGQATWDLVIVDEAHHLLAAPEYYKFIRGVSARSPGLLLLSALPAQQRKTEFLHLLALLEPDRYGDTPPEDFDRLFDAQTDIGRQLRRLRRRLEEEDSEPDEIREVAEDLVSIPALSPDPLLKARFDAVANDPAQAVEAGWELLRDAASRGRINRRILRNRRARLVEEGLVEPTTRELILKSYEPGQPEMDAVGAVARLVRALSGRMEPSAWSALTRLLVQALAHPETAFETVVRLSRVQLSEASPSAPLGHLAGVGGWSDYRDGLLSAARRHLHPRAVSDAVCSVRTWRDAGSALERVTVLADELERLERRYKKIIVFAGFPGLLDHLVPYLTEQFEPESITVFRADMGREEKEANVDRFRTDPEAWLLVSDESGGEGRNFQFAAAVFHYDTPWYVSRVEQRIGRLDRLGRKVPEVPSCVLYGEGTPEHELVRCFAEGFGVYAKSVSGLEFALRDLEADVVRTLLGGPGADIDSYLPLLWERAERERGRAEADAVLDEASFNREAASHYRRGEDLADAEAELEEAFVDYLRKAGSGNAARHYADREFPDGVWDLDREELRHITLGDGTPEHAGASRFRGTFRRGIAQIRHDLQFFSVGHPFFDGIIASARSQQCGRVYAVDVDAPDEAPWAGFEFVLTAGPDESVLGELGGLSGRVSRPFAVPPVHVFVDGDGRVAPNSERLLALRGALTGAGKDRTWWNLTKEKTPRAAAAFPNRDWREVVFHASVAAKTEGRRLFAERLGPAIEAELGGLSEARGAAHDKEEASALEAASRALRDWAVRVDAAGFLSVNGKLGRAR
jgi:ATP-dependent helicase HepA